MARGEHARMALCREKARRGGQGGAYGLLLNADRVDEDVAGTERLVRERADVLRVPVRRLVRDYSTVRAQRGGQWPQERMNHSEESAKNSF